jgi:hypothetical protein
MTTKRKASAKKKKSPAKRRKIEVAAAEEKFVSDLLIRGEAAYPDSEGNLPSNATHEIVEEKKDGKLPKVQRRLYKMF